MWSKGASLGIRRDRETFSVRHRTAAHKARHAGQSRFWQHILDGLTRQTVALGRKQKATAETVAGAQEKRNYAELPWKSAADLRRRAFSYHHSSSPAARQPNTQTNSDSSRDDSDGPPDAKVPTGSSHGGRRSRIRILAGSHQQIECRLLRRQRPGIITAAHAGHLPGLDQHA